MIARIGEASPYGAFATTLELKDGIDFVDDYALAFRLGRDTGNVSLENVDKVSQIIRDAVSKSLGANVTSARVLAVAALTAEARVRFLRREEWRGTKELRTISRERMNLWPPFSIKRIKDERALLRRQAAIYSEQGACHKAYSAYMAEAFEIAASSLDTIPE